MKTIYVWNTVLTFSITVSVNVKFSTSPSLATFGKTNDYSSLKVRGAVLLTKIEGVSKSHFVLILSGNPNKLYIFGKLRLSAIQKSQFPHIYGLNMQISLILPKTGKNLDFFNENFKM